MIRFEEAANDYGVSCHELLDKVKGLGLKVYCLPPASTLVWEFKSITNDPDANPMYSFLKAYTAQPNKYGVMRRPYYKKECVKKECVSPVKVERACYFALGEKEIDSLVQTNSMRTKGFPTAFQLSRGVMVPLEVAEPSKDEVNDFRSQLGRPFGGRRGLISDVFFTDFFYGLCESGVSPASLSGLGVVLITVKDLYFLKSDLPKKRGQRAKKKRPDPEIVVDIFPQFNGLLGTAANKGHVPGKMIFVLAVCISAWGRVKPGEKASVAYDWIKKRLSEHKTYKFGKEAMEKFATLYAHDYGYTGDRSLHDRVKDPKRPSKMLVRGEGDSVEELVYRSGLLVLVDAWDEYLREANWWDAANQKPDQSKKKIIQNDVDRFLDAYLSEKIRKWVLPLLMEASPDQGN